MSLSQDIKFVQCKSFHGRYGTIENKFTYNVDCVLIPVHEKFKSSSKLFKHNAFGLFSFHDKDHGMQGTDIPVAEFAKDILQSEGLTDVCDGQIWLFTQPRCLGYIFNPVSFWYFHNKTGQLIAVMAEVNNRDGGRHFYICRHDDYRPIGNKDKIRVEKIFHVSPFQERQGEYEFKFRFEGKRIGAWIDYKNGDDGVYTTLSGKPTPLKTSTLIKSACARPFGALRIVFLIYWQALKLKFKGGTYRKAPRQNEKRISR
ncbi:MAG: DUF1365 domain-containing protein [Robiginitomaculum sp.]|nr:DUF1365 domain-containing protein [Robiginitomaculum sp.]